MFQRPHHRRLKGGVFFFGDGQRGAVGERDLEPADIPQKVRVDEIALVAAQKQRGISLFQRRHGGHDLRFAGYRVQHAVLAAAGGFDPIDGIG